MPETNAERLQRAADLLRENAADGQRSEYVARMLEHCKLIADFWQESYAYPFIPLLEAALGLTGIILGDRPARFIKYEGLMALGDRPLKMRVSAQILHELLRLPVPTKLLDGVYKHDGDLWEFTVLVRDAPEGAIEMEPIYHRTNSWPDPVHLHDINWFFPPGTVPPAAADAPPADPDV